MKKFLLVCFSLCFVLSAWAQERVITGRVTSADDGSSLPGVNVVVKGTTNGTVTDADGKYSLSILSADASLVFSFIGLKTTEVTVGDRSVVDVQLGLDITQLSEVVVTALGVKRDAKSITYANQQITSENLVIARPNNITDAMAGKVAGLQVRSQSGATLGRNSTIRIRGASSLEDGGPLYVLDGTPVSSNDINPDDIENINVLKGPAATALYGQRGDRGVIMMTSKTAKKGSGLGIDINQSVFADQVYILPRQQNTYAGGAYADLVKFTWQPGMPTDWQSLDGKYYPDYTDDGSWGPKMVGQEYIPWYAWAPGTKYSGKTAKLTPQPNNIRDFYNTGVNRITNISLAKADDKYSIRFSYTNQGQTGLIPNTALTKNNFSTQFSAKLGDLVTIGANINYSNQWVKGDNNDAYSNQTSGSFNQWFHRDLDVKILNELSDLRSPGGRLVSWNHFNPTSYFLLDDPDKIYRGYYWFGHRTYAEKIDYQNTRSRLFGDINIGLDLTKDLKVQVFYRKNESTSITENKRPSILPFSFNTELRPTNQDQWDYYGTATVFSKEDNLEFLASFNKTLLESSISINANVGANIRMEKYIETGGNTVNGLTVPDLFTLSNSKTTPFGSTITSKEVPNFRQNKEVRSIYGRASVGYKDIVFVDFAARNDWSSALPANANSYFYPSVGVSFVFSELTESSLPFLSYGKLRASTAQVGTDLDPYKLGLLYGLGTVQWNGNTTSNTPNTLTDANIKPSLSTSNEFGLDLKFFQNRLGFSATYFNQIRTNEILPITVSGSSGFTQKLVNAGRLESSGIEIQIDATPVKSGDFTWTTMINFAKIQNKVVQLAPGVNAIPQNNGNSRDAFATATIYNIEGQQWGQLRGFGIQKINGKPVIGSDGFYVPIQNQNLGSVLPDFTGGFINNLNYKNFGLSFNVDFQQGGKFFSLSDWFGTFSGLTERTAQLNDKGVAERTPVADGGGVHVVGVDENGAPKDTYVEGKLYYQQFVNNSIAENSILDLSFVKLRELSFTYRVPVNKIGLGKVFRAASVSVVGRNLWLIYSGTKDYDPSMISNTFGENGQFPGTRSLGMNIKLSF